MSDKKVPDWLSDFSINTNMGFDPDTDLWDPNSEREFFESAVELANAIAKFYKTDKSSARMIFQNLPDITYGSNDPLSEIVSDHLEVDHKIQILPYL